MPAEAASPPGPSGPAGFSDQPDSSGTPPLVRLLQEFSLQTNRYVDAAGGRNNMHRTDLTALSVIMAHTARNEIVTPGILRKELNLSSPATTALIDRLHGSGHVVRERQGADRRQVQLRMTPKAYRDGGAMFLPLARQMGAAMAEFTPEELEVATRFLTSMIEATIRAGQETAEPSAAPQAPRTAAGD